MITCRTPEAGQRVAVDSRYSTFTIYNQLGGIPVVDAQFVHHIIPSTVVHIKGLTNDTAEETEGKSCCAFIHANSKLNLSTTNLGDCLHVII